MDDSTAAVSNGKALAGSQEHLDFSITVLGRTLEHLGVQMYKYRPSAIAELIANSWDAGAKNAWLRIPNKDEYSKSSSSIELIDDGSGMSAIDIDEHYLVVGRDCRVDGDTTSAGRQVMGRKGIGKLAGFGIAEVMTVTTWTPAHSDAVCFRLLADELRKDDDISGKVPVIGQYTIKPYEYPSGTVITLEKLRHVTPIDLDELRESLVRRFSEHTRSEMKVHINDTLIASTETSFQFREPAVGLASETLEDGSTIKSYYAFSDTLIKRKEHTGFAIYVRGKVAQAPPFFFGVDSNASGFNGTRYISGAIEADFLDNTAQSDVISTDRQDIDWEADQVQLFKKWGDEFARKVLRTWAERREEDFENWILKEKDFQSRVNALESPLQKQALRFIRTIAKARAVEDEEAVELTDALLSAFEYRHFHGQIQKLEDLEHDLEGMVELLRVFRDWSVLESRAILEIVKGRLTVVDKFHSMIVSDTAEVAHKKGDDNLHDLIASYPWLVNPHWEVLREKKTLSRELREYHHLDCPETEKKLRYDFLGLAGDDKHVIIEIKRQSENVDITDMTNFLKYWETLGKAYTDLEAVMITGGSFAVDEKTRQMFERNPAFHLWEWNEVKHRVRKHYEIYRDVLEKNVRSRDFTLREAEVKQTRSLIESGSYRGAEGRKTGIGPAETLFKEGGPAERG